MVELREDAASVGGRRIGASLENELDHPEITYRRAPAPRVFDPVRVGRSHVEISAVGEVDLVPVGINQFVEEPAEDRSVLGIGRQVRFTPNPSVLLDPVAGDQSGREVDVPGLPGSDDL